MEGLLALVVEDMAKALSGATPRLMVSAGFNVNVYKEVNEVLKSHDMWVSCGASVWVEACVVSVEEAERVLRAFQSWCRKYGVRHIGKSFDDVHGLPQFKCRVELNGGEVKVRVILSIETDGLRLDYNKEEIDGLRRALAKRFFGCKELKRIEHRSTFTSYACVMH